MTPPRRPANDAQKHRAARRRRRHHASSRRSVDAADEARVAMDLVVRNARLHPTAGAYPEPVDIGIDDGRITAIRDRGQLEPAGREIDAEGSLLSPPLVDPHVHMD